MEVMEPMAAIGKVIDSEFASYVDSDTGAHVTRVTGGRHVCHHIYPTPRSTTTDGKFLLLFRELSKNRQLFAMNLIQGYLFNSPLVRALMIIMRLFLPMTGTSFTFKKM